VSYLLSAVKEDDIPRLLASAYRSLRPGGLLMVLDFMLDDERGPVLAAQWFLLDLAFQPGAGSFSAATLSVLLAGQGVRQC
jgi:2-hydroxy-4-(methylsulfanyl)butanoate S-methyltransferase